MNPVYRNRVATDAAPEYAQATVKQLIYAL